MALSDSPQSEVPLTTPQTSFEGKYGAIIREVLKKGREGTSLAALSDHLIGAVPAGQEQGKGRNLFPCIIGGEEFLTLPIGHAQEYGITTDGALIVFDTQKKPDRGPCILVPSIPYISNGSPAPISRDNIDAIATLEGQGRYQLAA